MGKIKRKNRKSLIIISILILLIILVTLLTIFVNNNYQQTLSLNKKLTTELNELKNTHQEKDQTNKELTTKLNNLTNITENTNNLKQEVFTLASKLEQKIIKKESKAKIAYLTFDDGPYYLTNKYLEVLKKYQVKGTFFTIGLDKDTCFDNKNKDCSNTYKKIVDDGHTIANHTYSHLIFKGLYSSPTAFINQVKKQENLIKKRTGVTTNIVRFPGGSGTAQAYGVKDGAIKQLRKLGYGWVDWDAMDGDGGAISSKSEALKIFKKSINDNIEVVLLHDYSYTTLAILPDIIEYLQNKNYILLPLFYNSIKINK